MTGRGEKVSSSVRLEPWQRDYLKQHSHLNVSELFRQFIDELAGGGRERPDGLAFRESMLEEQIDDLEATLELKRARLGDVREQLEAREDHRSPAIDDAIEAVKRGDASVTPEDGIIRRKAEAAGMAPEAFVNVLADYLDGEEWVVSSNLKSISDQRFRFNRERFDAGNDPIVAAGGREADDD